MPLLILSGIIQLALVVHVLKTGRNTYWIWLILMVPFIGAAAYLIIEIGPELNGSPGGQVLLDKECFDEAMPHFKKALTGLNEYNPSAMVGLAQAEFGAEFFHEAKLTLDTLIDKNPGYKDQDSHLLYARVLEQLGDIEGASEEYETLIKYYTGPEPHIRFAELQFKQGNTHRGNELIEEVLTNAKHSPAHYTRLHKDWINRAKQLKNNPTANL